MKQKRMFIYLTFKKVINHLMESTFRAAEYAAYAAAVTLGIEPMNMDAD